MRSSTSSFPTSLAVRCRAPSGRKPLQRNSRKNDSCLPSRVLSPRGQVHPGRASPNTRREFPEVRRQASYPVRKLEEVEPPNLPPDVHPRRRHDPSLSRAGSGSDAVREGPCGRDPLARYVLGRIEVIGFLVALPHSPFRSGGTPSRRGRPYVSRETLQEDLAFDPIRDR
jgi:hypothetical protein